MFPGWGIRNETATGWNNKFPIGKQFLQFGWQTRIRGCNHNKPRGKIVSTNRNLSSFLETVATETRPNAS
jgi:hypothetical protein